LLDRESTQVLVGFSAITVFGIVLILLQQW
jgi:hypothetical protein